MPAAWPSFINNLKSYLLQPSNKLEDTAKKIADEYHNALNGKAQTQVGNLYSGSGQKSLIQDAFKKGFEILAKDKTSKYEDKVKEFKDTKLEPIPTGTTTKDTKQFNIDFKKWLRTDANDYYKSINKKQPIYSFYEIIDDITNRPLASSSKFVFQELNSQNENITKIFKKTDTSVPENFNIDKIISLRSISTWKVNQQLFYTNYDNESKIYKDSQSDYINSIAAKEKSEDKSNSGNDPYKIMAEGVINYWLSVGTTSFAAAPAVFPALIPTPGTFTIITSGVKNNLAKDIRTALNIGVQAKDSATGATLVSTALALAFAKHILTIKFLYSGAIPAPSGTSPMVGLATIF